SSLKSYPDFGGVLPFLSASQAKSTSIPSLTQALSTTPGSTSPNTTTTGESKSSLVVLLGLGALVLILVLVSLVLLLRRQRIAGGKLVYVVPEGEEQLDLLPPNMPLEDLEKYQLPVDTEQTTIPLPAFNARDLIVDEQPTYKLPVPPVP